MSRVGRNEPCRCGSGKKFKKCCESKSAAGSGYSRPDRQVALEALEELLNSPGWAGLEEEAEAEFWGELDPEQTAIADDETLALMSEQVFDWWLFFDYEYEPGRYVVDALLEVTPSLPRGARSFLELARATTLRVYQVTEVRPGVGMVLRDVITGRETRVAERTGSQQMRRWDVIATRIMPAGATGDPVLDGGVLPIAMARAEAVIEWLRSFVKSAERDRANDESDKDTFAMVVPDLHRAWVAPMAPPTLINFDGDPLIVARSYFDIAQEEAAMAALDAARELERVEPEGAPPRWDWSGHGKDRKEPVLLGWIRLDAQRLVLETNSLARVERGRKLIERLAGDSVTYRVTRTEDLKQAMQARGSAPAAAALPPELREVSTAVLEQRLTLHLEQWVDERIPRLGDATPREATASAELRPRVVEMLKELEVLYEKALSSGQAAADPTWIWDELGLANERDAPGQRKQAPVLGHEALYRHFPDLASLTRDVAARVGRGVAPQELSVVVSDEDLARDLAYQRFARASPDPEFARHAALAFSNYELYLRKVFWVGESLSWLLGATKLDVTGEAVRLPFRSLALVFTDRYALGLAERMDSRLPPEARTGRMLQVLTVYLTQTSGEEGDDEPRLLDLTLVGDVLDGTRPTVVPCRVELKTDARLDQILQSASPGVAGLEEDDGVRPLYESTPLKDLLALVINALLYATSKDAEAREVQPSPQRSPEKHRHKTPVFTAETVFYLPGTIDIKLLGQVKKARRGGREHELTRRCMVRGHWRRAQPGWEDQRPRWVRPHWRGPSAAAIVERQYRLEE
jgi:SEC-C motif